ncbi:hypothetical protein, partial [Clostridium sp.]|uniref:hypothetical protein n=1 Tax=Clostridium sp. TaxID=1506 RepID=UPI00307FB30F
LSDSSEKGELDGLFLRIGNFALWQKTLITTVMNTIVCDGGVQGEADGDRTAWLLRFIIVRLLSLQMFADADLYPPHSDICAQNAYNLIS